MAVGSQFAKRVQIGTESSRGTAVAATAILLPDQDGFSYRENRVFHAPQDERVSLSAFHASRRQLAGIESMDWSLTSDATYEQLPYWLNGVVEPATVTGSDPYTYTYAPSYTSTNSQAVYTLEFGEDLQAYEAEFAYVKSMTLSGQPHSAVKVSVNGCARQKSETTFTGALTAPTVEAIMGNSCQLYYGTSWSNLTGGGTLATASLVDWNVTLNSGLEHSKRTDGNNYFTLLGEKKRQIGQFAFTLEWNTVVNTTLDLSSDFQAGTQQWFEIRTAGTASRALQIQLSCFIDTFEMGPVVNGICTARVAGGTFYDATGTAEAQVILVNKVQTLP